MVESWDAGRFVCNDVYYQSLRHAAIKCGAASTTVSGADGEPVHAARDKPVQSLFVHVPGFRVIDKDAQLCFVAALLRTLAFCERAQS